MIDLKMTKREEELANRVYVLEDALQVCMDALAEIAPGYAPAIEQGVIAEAARNEAKAILQEIQPAKNQ
jgi:hypothetical protein